MKYPSYLIVVGLLEWSGAYADTSVNQFLRQAVVETLNETSLASAARPGGLNRWLNDAQLRLADDPDKRGYALRLSPKMPSQISAERVILGLRREQLELSEATDLNDRLLLRYEQWLDLMEQQSRVDALTKARELADAEVRLQRELAGTQDFRPNALLEAELSLTRHLEQDRVQRERLAATRAALDINALPNGVVAIEEMLKVVALTPLGEGSMGQRVESLALQLAQQKRRAERAQQSWALDLLQVEVATDTRTHTSTTGFLVGVQLPLGGASFNTAQREYDLLGATADLKRRTIAAQRGADNRRELLNWRKSEADAIRESLAKIEAREQRARQSGNTTILLAVQREQVKARERLAEVRHLALRHYLEYLHLSGQLAQQPLRNWLTSGQQRL
jgi:hypothetical protein